MKTTPKISHEISSHRSGCPRELVAFMKAHGKRKVLFGSNYPMIMPQKALEGLEALGLDDAAKALFLGGNAQRVFKL